jgi:hypothetical protein
MAIDYLLWTNSLVIEYACILGEITGFEDEDLYEMWTGASFKDRFPGDVELAMSDDFPDNTIMTDNLRNGYNLVIASEKLKAFFEKQNVPHVEYLPVKIRDHRGKVAGRYHIIHPLDSVDCLDYQASGAVFSKVIKTHVDRVTSVVLRKNVIDPDRTFFRVAGYPKARLIRQDLADAIVAVGFTGVKFRGLDEKTR